MAMAMTYYGIPWAFTSDTTSSYNNIKLSAGKLRFSKLNYVIDIPADIMVQYHSAGCCAWHYNLVHAGNNGV